MKNENSQEAKKILIIDDEVRIIEFLRDYFSNKGFDVMVAADINEGYRKSITSKPDLIIIDIAIENQKGITLLDMMMLNQKASNIPVVVLTNLPKSLNNESPAKQLKCSEYLIKANLSLDEIGQKIEKILNTGN